MISDAQLAANRANAQLSTGPKTAEGKEAVALNNFRHGLAGAFHFLAWEKPAEFDNLLSGLRAEHNPQTTTEQILVERMAQHEWLRRRAQTLQHICFDEAGFVAHEKERQFALYLRYQTTHERSFHKCLSELLMLRAEKRKTEIGFESQKQKEAGQARKQELHEARARLANAKAAHLELDTDIKGTIEARIPGHTPIAFDEIKSVLKIAIEEVFGGRVVTKAA